jgi:Tfp pilus assembly protein PilN
MSVRVNLLPEATKQRDRTNRQRSAVLAAGLAFVMVLGGAYWWQVGRVNEAQDELLAEQARLSELQGDLAQLREFEELESRREAVDDRIILALGDEASVAGILQDIAAVMPAEAQLDQLTVSLAAADPNAATAGRPSVGSFTAVGRTLLNHAPGVERLLLELEKVAAFHDLFVSDSRLEDPAEPYATFTVESRLGPEVQTGRYDHGVPEELR